MQHDVFVGLNPTSKSIYANVHQTHINKLQLGFAGLAKQKKEEQVLNR